MHVLSILLLFIIPIIALAVIVAIGLSKKLAPEDILICALPTFILTILPIIIQIVLARTLGAFSVAMFGTIRTIIVLIGIISSVILLVTRIKKRKITTASQNVSVPATVVSKRYDVIGENIAYCVSFNIEGKGITEFTVPLSQFEIMNEGESGTITYRNNVFFSFTK